MFNYDTTEWPAYTKALLTLTTFDIIQWNIYLYVCSCERQFVSRVYVCVFVYKYVHHHHIIFERNYYTNIK